MRVIRSEEHRRDVDEALAKIGREELGGFKVFSVRRETLREVAVDLDHVQGDRAPRGVPLGVGEQLFEHGGAMRAENHAEGGACFRILLPLDQGMEQV